MTAATRITCTACQYQVSAHLSTAGLCHRKACVKARATATATTPAVPVQPAAAATQPVPVPQPRTVQAPTPEPAKAELRDCACCCEPAVVATMVTDDDGCLVCPPCRHNGYDAPAAENVRETDERHPDYDGSLCGVEPRCPRCGRLVYNCRLAGQCDDLTAEPVPVRQPAPSPMKGWVNCVTCRRPELVVECGTWTGGDCLDCTEAKADRRVIYPYQIRGGSVPCWVPAPAPAAENVCEETPVPAKEPQAECQCCGEPVGDVRYYAVTIRGNSTDAPIHPECRDHDWYRANGEPCEAPECCGNPSVYDPASPYYVAPYRPQHETPASVPAPAARPCPRCEQPVAADLDCCTDCGCLSLPPVLCDETDPRHGEWCCCDVCCPAPVATTPVPQQHAGKRVQEQAPTAPPSVPQEQGMSGTPTAPHCPHHRPARQCVYCLAALKATYAAASTVTPVVTPTDAPRHATNPAHTKADWVPYTREVYGYLIDPVAYADRVKPVLPVAYPPKAWELPGTNAAKADADLAGAPGAAYCDMTGTATLDEVLAALRYSNLRVSDTCSLTGSNHYAMTVSHGLAKALVAAGLARYEDVHRTGRHRRSVVIATADRAEARDGYLEGADNEAAVKYGDDSTLVKVRYKGEVVEVTRALARVMVEQVKDAKRSSKRGKKAKADAAARGWQIDDSNTRVTGDHTLERWLVITEAGRRHVDALDEAKATRQQREQATQMAKTTGKAAAHGLTEEQAAKVRWYDLTTPAGERHWAAAKPSAVTRLCRLMGNDWLPAVVGKRRESPAEHYARVEALLRYYADALRQAEKRGQSSKPAAAPQPTPRTPQPKEMFVPAPQPGPGLSALAKATKAGEAQPTLPGERIVVLRGANGEIPTVSQPRVYATLSWTVTVEGKRTGIPFVRADGTESFMVLGYRRSATAVAWGDEASGMADYWRLSQLERNNGDRGDLTLHHSYSGDAGTWVKAGTLTEAEAVAWLDGRSGGRGKSLLAALLAS